MKNITAKIFITIGILLISSLAVNAGFGVSPTDLNHKYLRPGSTFEKEFTISRSQSLEEMDITIEPTFENISSWFTYYPSQSFKFEKGETKVSFKIVVNVPENANFQDYNGVFRVKAQPSEQDVQGISITQGVRLDSDLVVTKSDMRLLSILSIKVLDSVEGENIKVQIIGENKGNVDASPNMKIRIMDLNMNTLEEHDIFNFGFIKPNETSTLTGEFDTNLPTGEYFVEVTVLLEGEELRKERLVFQINNIPTEEKEQQDSNPSFIGSIITTLRENIDYVIYISSATVIFVSSYIYIGKVWNKKGLKKKRKELWAIILGSKMYSRLLLSFFIALTVMLSLILLPLLKEERVEYALVEKGETQGVNIENNSLLVFPPYEIKEYLIFEEPNTQSKIIYKAQENEQFKVLEKLNGWYKVQLQENVFGWLQEDLVKTQNP